MIRMRISGGTFLLVPAHPGSPGQRAIKRLHVCVCVKLPILPVDTTVVTRLDNVHSHMVRHLQDHASVQ